MCQEALEVKMAFIIINVKFFYHHLPHEKFKQCNKIHKKDRKSQMYTQNHEHLNNLCNLL